MEHVCKWTENLPNGTGGLGGDQPCDPHKVMLNRPDLQKHI